MKSLITSVAFPAWGLGKKPHKKFLCGAYSDDLSTDLSTKTRDIMESQWYRDAFPKTMLRTDQNEKTRFDTTARGYRIAASVGGGRATGFGGDIVIIDDPLNPKKADSKADRFTANKWILRTMKNRLNNKNTGIIILVMHRLHTNDPSGLLLEQGGWEHIRLPAENDGPPKTFFFKRPYVTNDGREVKAKIWKSGEVLHPERFPGEFLLDEKKDSYYYAGQYQQTPVPDGGGMIKLAWIKRFTVAPVFDYIVISGDTASKAEEINDPSVFLVIGVTKTANYLIDVVKGRWEYPDLKRTIMSLGNKWMPLGLNAILLEDKSSGMALIQDLKRETKLPIIPILPEADKVTRMRAESGQIESGRWYAPESAPWLADYEFEITSFPKVDHDDQVDATSQFLKWIRGKTDPTNRPRIRTL